MMVSAAAATTPTTTTTEMQAIKMEDSPAESFISTPGQPYPSLFESTQNDTTTPSAAPTPAPEEGDGQDVRDESPESPDGKKGTKKRKSWGQVLPEPKTNLPPRKRAKTEDEKEQRRVERVLRNRRAAQSSRERKRLEVEALERKNQELEEALNHARQANAVLSEELKKYRRDSSPFDPLTSGNAVTLSQQLFGTQPNPALINELHQSAQPEATVNPASLSPALSPVAEDNETEAQEVNQTKESTTQANATGASADLTQRPAAMLCDLQCQSEQMPRSFLASETSLRQQQTWTACLQTLTMVSTLVSACQRPLMQIAMSLKAGFSLPPTQPIMRTIIWLVTSRSTSASSSTKRTSRRSSTNSNSTSKTQQTRSAASPLSLRLRSLQKILTCSPNLARPLLDATMEALRLVSSEELFEVRASGSEVAGQATRGDLGAVAHDDQQQRKLSHTWLNGKPLPSKEVLLTLLWALRCEERKLTQRGTLAEKEPLSRTESSVLTTGDPASISLDSAPSGLSAKRKGGVRSQLGQKKRSRFS